MVYPFMFIESPTIGTLHVCLHAHLIVSYITDYYVRLHFYAILRHSVQFQIEFYCVFITQKCMFLNAQLHIYFIS